MDARPESAFTWNGVVADFAAETLHGPTGAPIPLRRQSFAVLRHLAANPNRLVTKDELLAAVWPDVAVTDDSLVQCIHDIRRALGDDSHTVLATVPRRGYRLVLPDRGPPSPAPRRLRAIAAGVAALLLLAAGLGWWRLGADAAPPEDLRPVVAVLEFVNLGGDQATRRLAMALKKDLATDLADFREFDVVLRGASFRPSDPAEPAFAVGGSVLRRDGRLRITEQLLDARTGNVLWSERWDRPDDDVLSVLAEVSEVSANRLGGGAGLIQEAGRIAAHGKRPGDRGAYDLYLLGTQQLEQLTRPGVEAAIELLGQAVAIDPGMARAWVELYHSHILLHFMGVDAEHNRELAAAAAERALLLDPRDAEAHAVVGMSHAIAGDLVRARSGLDAALALAPKAAEILTFYSYWAASFGEPERGAELADRVLRLEPNLPPWKPWLFAHAYFLAGRHEDALAMLDRLDPAAYNRVTWAIRPAALAALGRTDEARQWTARALEAHPDLSVERQANEPGYTDAGRGRFVETMRLAGFPACATPEALAAFPEPRRLPECVQHATAKSRPVED